MTFDALLVLSFGGPEGPDDVAPFLERVTSGRPIPPARVAEVAERYQRRGGVSPINAAVRDLIARVRPLVDLPVYWGNRNWHPLLEDTVQEMADAGVRHAACFVTSAYGGYSACGQYLEDIERARATVGSDAPAILKLAPYSTHPRFLDAMAENTALALDAIDPTLRPHTHLAFSAHSIPRDQPGADRYERQVRAASAAVAGRVPGNHEWAVCWQSRSGPPTQPWLEPDVSDHLRALAGVPAVVLVPVGFVVEHMEIAFDLDDVASGVARSLGMAVQRAAAVGGNDRFVRIIPELLRDPGLCVDACCVRP